MRTQSARIPLGDLFSVAAAASLLSGAVAVQTLSALPPFWITISLAVAGIALTLVRGRWRWLGFVLLGAAWTLWRADAAMSARLSPALEGEDIVVTGAIRGLPRTMDESTRFDFDLRTAEHNSQPLSMSGVLRLSWYDTAPTIRPCEIWRLHVRLKRPRGMIDPGLGRMM